MVLPAAGEDEVDEGGNVGDADFAIAVAVGILEVDVIGVAGEDVVDEGGDVGDGHRAVFIGVAAQVSSLLGQSPQGDVSARIVLVDVHVA